MTTRKAAQLAAAATRSSPRTRQRSSSLATKDEASPSPAKIRKISRAPSTPLKAIKSEVIDSSIVSPTTLRDRKLKSHANAGVDGPFPTFQHPTPDECDKAHSILVALHGPRNRPAKVIASTSRAGCGDSPNVLDALVRTILSQNTSDVNSTRAKLSMDAAYGRSDKWDAIASGGQAKLEESIRCGGLSQVKSKVILRILEQAKEKYGDYTLDHLHTATSEDAMAELLAFDGVGPKTASCVLLFCLQRDDFAVDTHVHRITGLLGWTPKKANREQTYQHLNRRIPDKYKYALHILIITHGKRCDECKAGGRNTGKCELRKAFKQVDSGVKMEDLNVKQEGKQEETMLETMQDEDVKPDVKPEA